MEEGDCVNNDEYNKELVDEDNEMKEEEYQQHLNENDLNERYSYDDDNKEEHIEINTLNSNETIEKANEIPPLKTENYDEEEGEEEEQQQHNYYQEQYQEDINNNSNIHLNQNDNKNINIEDNNNNISIHNTNENQPHLLNSNHNNYQISDSTANNNIPSTEHHHHTPPLIPLNTLYFCQFCQSEFDSHTHIPYLFKCNHFFCKTCIETHFLTKEGIKCPNDGIIASSLSECDILTNIIPHPHTSSQSHTCLLHKSQPLTHYVEETREVICVYCAFSKMRSNPKLTIKEINEKTKEYISDIEQLYVQHNQYVNFLQELLSKITEHKQVQEEKVCGLFDQMISYLDGKKKMILNKIGALYASNYKVINDKIGLLERKEEIAEEIKREFDNVEGNEKGFNEVVDRFNEFLRDGNEKEQFDLEISEYNFAHDDENKAYKYINNFGDLKSKKRQFKFGARINSNITNNNNSGMIDSVNNEDNDNMQYGDNVIGNNSKKNINKKSFFNFGEFARTSTNPNIVNNNSNVDTEIYNEYKTQHNISSYKKQNFPMNTNNVYNNTSRNNNINNDRFASLTKYTIPKSNYNNNQLNSDSYQFYNQQDH